jgi:hypothetical protein
MTCRDMHQASSDYKGRALSLHETVQLLDYSKAQLSEMQFRINLTGRGS